MNDREKLMSFKSERDDLVFNERSLSKIESSSHQESHINIHYPS
jgi:hypothetical protein